MPLDAQKLKDFLVSELGVTSKVIEDSTPLFSSNLLDSFSLVELMMYVEKEAGLRMSPGDVSLDNLDSVEKILSFAQRRG